MLRRGGIAGASLAAAFLLACGGSAGPDCSPQAAGSGWIAFTSNREGHYGIFLARQDGACLQPLTDAQADRLFPAWTPAGALGFSSTQAGGPGVYVQELATGLAAGIPILGAVAAAPAWSTDGRWLAFEGKAPGSTRSDVYLVLARGGGAVALTSGPGNSGGPAWSPDGATLYFVSNRTGAYQIFSMDAAGGGQAALVGTAGVLGRPAVAPDGRSLAYARIGGGGAAEVVVRDVASGAERVVSSQGDSEPAFDATGQRLAVSSTRGGKPGIWIIDAADGAHPVQVSNPPGTAVDGQPALPQH